jgi:transcriptional regulator with XRE-family HTH domain
MASSTIGDRIKKLRKKHGLSQRALALAADMRQPSISALEKGTSTWVRGSTLLRLADVLGVKADWLENGGPHNKVVKAKTIDTTLQMLIENYQHLNEDDRSVLLDLAKSLRRKAR